MREILFVRDGFRHADDGMNVVEYSKGLKTVSERCAEVAVAEGYAQERPAATSNPDANQGEGTSDDETDPEKAKTEGEAPLADQAGSQTGEAEPAPSSPQDPQPQPAKPKPAKGKGSRS